MNVRLALVLNAIYLPGFLINWSIQDKSSQLPEGMLTDFLRQSLKHAINFND